MKEIRGKNSKLEEQMTSLETTFSSMQEPPSPSINFYYDSAHPHEIITCIFSN